MIPILKMSQAKPKIYYQGCFKGILSTASVLKMRWHTPGSNYLKKADACTGIQFLKSSEAKESMAFWEK